MKRSSQVALLLMGVTGVGATGYMMSRPPPNCIPQGSPAATMAPAAPAPGAAEPCPPRRSWSSSGSGWGYRTGWTRTNNSTYSSSRPWPVFSRTTNAGAATAIALSNRSATATRSTTTTTTTQRSGFGSTSSSVSRSSSS